MKPQDLTLQSRSFGPHVGGRRGEWALLHRQASKDPESTWQRLIEILELTEDEDSLMWVADVWWDLAKHDEWNFAERMEMALPTSPRLRLAFTEFVPLGLGDELEDHLMALRERTERELAAAGLLQLPADWFD
ncbi:MAG TPA: hypothetical protein VGQ66_03600 [Candidatus Limnocylindria bacterium]|jgi:hypothetical protein|nr:hypothetical protein [Candidatus Limnocylindria bacterium]